MTPSDTERTTERSSRPSRRDEEYRRRTFERLGLYDVAAISMALRRITSPQRRSSSTTTTA